MATLTVQEISRSGIVPTYGAAAGGGDQFLNTGREFLAVVNGLVDVNVTMATQGTVDSQAIGDRTETVSASTTQFLGPFPPAIYNDSSGYVQLTYDDVSNVTVGVFRL